MSHLISRNGHLLRDKHLLRLPEFPTDEIGHYNAPAWYKYEQWTSDPYDDPDDIDLGAAAVGVSDQLAAAEWKGSNSDRVRGFSYWFQSGRGPYWTQIRARQGCFIADVRKYAGLLADVSVYVADYVTFSGVGSYRIGLSTLSSATPGLGYTDSKTVTGKGYYTFSDVRLDAYLRLGCQVVNCTPPDEESAEPNFGLPRTFLYVLTGV